jgi:hypothetical protein
VAADGGDGGDSGVCWSAGDALDAAVGVAGVAGLGVSSIPVRSRMVFEVARRSKRRGPLPVRMKALMALVVADGSINRADADGKRRSPSVPMALIPSKVDARRANPAACDERPSGRVPVGKPGRKPARLSNARRDARRRSHRPRIDPAGPRMLAVRTPTRCSGSWRRRWHPESARSRRQDRRRRGDAAGAAGQRHRPMVRTPSLAGRR